MSCCAGGHSPRLFCAAWSHLFGRDQTRWLHSVYEKKPAHPANDIAERLALYSSGTIFLRGTITFPSSALIKLGTVKAGRRIYDLVTKGKTNLSTTRIKELIAGLDRPHVHGLGGDSRKLYGALSCLSPARLVECLSVQFAISSDQR